jgi:SAM-dependent methyltransferase
MSELERFERERRDADQRYNDALTALDRVIVAARSQPALDRADFARVTTALVVFLQQITSFVDTKDRELAADTVRRLDALAPAVESIAELRTQIGVLQRTLQTVRRELEPRDGQSHDSRPRPPAPGASVQDEITYLGFEDQFRGSDATIEERLRAYLPIFDGRSAVLDIGCGRGELLAALRAGGVTARGIDSNGEMVAVARERGLEAERADALAYLEGLADASLDGLVSTQVVEHLEPWYLMRLLEVAAQKLQRGAPIVLETINPACWLAFFGSYIRDLTHVRPVHPETLQYLLRASGFERVEIRYSAPVPELMKMKTVEIPGEILASKDPSALALARVAHAVSANAVILNNLMFTHLDYAAVGYRT